MGSVLFPEDKGYISPPRKVGLLDYGLDMPPGFRFHPTDLEIIQNYLLEKAIDPSFVSIAIGEVDLNTCEPWDLPMLAKLGEKEWWFFWRRDRKYPTGTRTNRATEKGYWKATGKDKEIFDPRSCLVGMKKTLVFYLGRAPKGAKTNWVMHEYRLEGKPSLLYTCKNDWVVCKVVHKTEPKKNTDEEGPPAMGPLDPHQLLLFHSSSLYTNMPSNYPPPPPPPPAPPAPYLQLDPIDPRFEEKCKIEEPAPTVASWDDPGSPSVAPLADLEEYMWN